MPPIIRLDIDHFTHHQQSHLTSHAQQQQLHNNSTIIKPNVTAARTARVVCGSLGSHNCSQLQPVAPRVPHYTMEFKPISKKRPFEKNGGKPKNRHRKRDDEEYDDPDESKPREQSKSSNQKLVFDDDGNTVAAGSKAGKAAYAARHQQQQQHGTDVDTKWFQVYASQNTNGELDELKQTELTELTNTCRTCFESELSSLQKRKCLRQLCCVTDI